MAELRRTSRTRCKPTAGSPEARHLLVAKNTVGRASHCDWRIARSSVSSVHAYIEWLGDHWVVRDLGSRNGTFANGNELRDGRRWILRVGDELIFGSREETWQVVNLAPPSLEGSSTVERHSTVHDASARSLRLADCKIHIRVAPDEESASVELRASGHRRQLPARTHLYLLAHLARERLAAASSGCADGGWVTIEEAARSLGVDAQYVAVQVFRIRRDIGRLNVVDAPEVIDRRRRGLLRLGVSPDRVHLVPSM